jgi:hypothetical protein
VSRDQQAVHGEIYTSVPLMLKRVPKEDTDRNGGLAYREQWQRLAGTPEDPKVGVGGSGAEKSKVGCGG